ncbi:hypothetical protein D3C80_1919450 [compost metagenome]
MLLDERRNVLNLHPAVKNPLRIDNYNRTQLTQPKTAGADYLHLSLNAAAGDFLLQCSNNFIGIRRCAASAPAYHH